MTDLVLMQLNSQILSKPVYVNFIENKYVSMVKLFLLPFFNSPGLGGEAGANLEELAQVSDVWLGITLVFYLLQGFVRRAVQFELEDIEVLRGLHDAVGTSLALLFLNVGGIHAHHPEYQVEGVIEVAFALLLVFLAPCRVGDAGQEGGEQVAQSVRLALAHGLHQGSYSDFMSSSGFR